jgi:hypothetical protein
MALARLKFKKNKRLCKQIFCPEGLFTRTMIFVLCDVTQRKAAESDRQFTDRICSNCGAMYLL